MQKKSFRNSSKFYPNLDDYQLVFVLVNGEFRECGHDIPRYANMLLSDYLLEMNLFNIPDYTQFLRILHPDYLLEFRSYGGRIRIDYKKREDF